MARTRFLPYFQPPILAIGLLGMASGLPLALTAATLSAWLFEAGIDKTTIGLFAAVATPYTLKFLWAPLMDGVKLPGLTRWLGRRRGWLLVTQIALVIGLATMSGIEPGLAPGAVAMAALFIAFASASQDIVADAYRTERLTEWTPEEGADTDPETARTEALGMGVAMFTLGYRLGMLVAGAGALYLADQYGWRATYGAMAVLMALFAGLTLLLREPAIILKSEEGKSSFAAWLREYVAAPFADFMRTPFWWAILLFIVTYKLGDAFLGVMTNPFLLEIGFTKTEIAGIVKLFGFTATILGSFVAAWCLRKYSMVGLLVGIGLLHAGTNLMFLWQAHAGSDAHLLAAGIALENFTGGISNGVFVVFISRLCHRQYTATQYALLSALAAFGRTNLSIGAGWVAARLGWESFFVICVALALPSLLLLGWLKRQGALSMFHAHEGNTA